ncbi:MAG: hypothetical protein AB7T38_02460 [Nitrospirales bacterium]
MAFQDSIEFKVDNLAGFAQAKRLAPKRILASFKRELQREGNKFQTEFRKGFLFGAPGINLPKRLRSFTKTGKVRFKKRTNRDAASVQKAHVITKVATGERGIVLVGYLSHFLGFHGQKLEGPFRAAFRRLLPRLKGRLEKEAARITQAVLDKGLRDANRGGGR